MIPVEEVTKSSQLPVLDPSGCLTPEVLCFVPELADAQRAAVERHVAKCQSCAQRQAKMASAAEAFADQCPETLVPFGARLAARSLLLRRLVPGSITAEFPIDRKRAYPGLPNQRRLITLALLAVAVSLTALILVL